MFNFPVLKHRFYTSIGLLLVALLAVFSHVLVFFTFSLVLLGFLAVEMINTYRLMTVRVSYKTWLVVLIWGILLATLYLLDTHHIVFGILIHLASLLWLFVAPILLLRGDTQTLGLMRSSWHCFFAFVTLSAFWASFVLLREASLVTFCMVWLFAVTMDIAAYFGGNYWGTVSLAPMISPGKTLQGAFVAFFVVTLVFHLIPLPYFLRTLPGWHYHFLSPVFFSLFAWVTILGDLYQSAIKRLAGVKNSGALLPGHGGVWDRFDSSIALFPVAYSVWDVLSPLPGIVA